MSCLPILSKLKVTSLTRIRAGVVLVWAGSEAAVLGANVLGFCMSVLNILVVGTSFGVSGRVE